LVAEFGEKPNLRIYASLILANARPEGSVAEVRALLEEMEGEGVELDEGACHDVLRVGCSLFIFCGGYASR
jgi:hypothetical protein